MLVDPSGIDADGKIALEGWSPSEMLCSSGSKKGYQHDMRLMVGRRARARGERKGGCMRISLR
jgi:hypothetical protein